MFGDRVSMAASSSSLSRGSFVISQQNDGTQHGDRERERIKREVSYNREYSRERKKGSSKVSDIDLRNRLENIIAIWHL